MTGWTVWLLIDLRREGESVSGWAFFKLGLVAMPLALGLCLLGLR